MRTISLWQPWASAIALGLKRIETRHWSTSYRGPLAIHAAQRTGPQLRAIFDSFLCQSPVFANAFAPFRWMNLHRGKVVAVCELFAVIPTHGAIAGLLLSREEVMLGDFSPGRFAWVLTNVRRLEEPFPCKGKQGFFNVLLPLEAYGKAA